MVTKFLKQIIKEIVDPFFEDYDRLFSYYTKQEVNVLDRGLGITQYIVMLSIAAYVVGVVFIADRGYLEREAAHGVIVTHVSGDAVGRSSGSKTGSRYFSADELTYPGLERGNVFVATKITVEEQTRGVCEDWSMRCHSADDCSKDVGAECTENRRCKEPSWCPEINSHGQPAREVYKLDTAETLILVKSSIQYGLLDPHKMFHESMEPVMYPKPGFNTITLRQVLLECTPPVRYEEVSELGAAIEVQWVWNCNVEFPTCEKKMVARRVDVLLDQESIGFKFTWPSYLGDDHTSNSEQREKKQMNGIRLYFRSVGTGYKLSVQMIIFKISTGMSLLGLAPILADLLMLNCFKLSKKYAARKYVHSKDFSDYFEGRGDVADDDVVDEEDEEDEGEIIWNSALADDEDITNRTY